MRLFRLKCTDDIILMPMKHQAGSSDCDVLPYLHVMTLLAYDEDPSEVKYRHSDLQEHFINYFTKNRSFFSTGVTTFYQRSGTW